MASLLHAASKGHLPRQCATTPVLIGSPHLSHVDRHSKGAAGHSAVSAGGHLHSTAVEISGVGLLSHAPLSINTPIICHGAAPEGAEIVGAGLPSRVLLSLNTKAVCLGAAPEGAGMSPRSGHRAYPTRLCAGLPLPSNLALNLAPFGRWTLRDKAAQRRLALR
jgi:hypothetical protein